MSKTTIGILFILAGLAYGSLTLDGIYNITLGYLVKYNWIKPPPPEKPSKEALGRKSTIIFYSLILIAIGIFLLWNRQT